MPDKPKEGWAERRAKAIFAVPAKNCHSIDWIIPRIHLGDLSIKYFLVQVKPTVWNQTCYIQRTWE